MLRYDNSRWLFAVPALECPFLPPTLLPFRQCKRRSGLGPSLARKPEGCSSPRARFSPQIFVIPGDGKRTLSRQTLAPSLPCPLLSDILEQAEPTFHATFTPFFAVKETGSRDSSVGRLTRVTEIECKIICKYRQVEVRCVLKSIIYGSWSSTVKGSRFLLIFFSFEVFMIFSWISKIR